MNYYQNHDLTILMPESVKVPWYLNLEPIKSSYIRKKSRKKASEILLGRKPEIVESIWNRTNIDVNLIAKVSKIIMEECNWPNALYIPEDRCSVLFSDVGYSMNSVEASLSIEQDIAPNMNKDIWAELNSMSYGELLKRLQAEIEVQKTY